MNNEVKYEISESENLIMEYLWKQEESKYFNEIMDYLNNECNKDWKKQTVNTFIKRLTEKGLITFSYEGRNKRYLPAMSYEKYKQGQARTILKEYYSNSISTFLSALTGGKKVDKKTAEELKNLLEEE